MKSTIVMGTSHNTLIAHLRNAETNHIGFSYNINTGDHNPDQGFMVSIKGYEETAPSGCDLIAFGRSYFLRHAEQLADPNYYMGCWVNAGRFIFDISENVQTKEIAIALGEHHDQEAIWDCASGSEYRLMREGDEPEEAGLGDYKSEDFDAMLHTLDVAMDEFNELHNHSRIEGMDDYYEIHMNQLDNIINLINKLK